MVFVPGQSGNPGGRPKGSGDFTKPIKPHLSTLIEMNLAKALKGDVLAANTVALFYSAKPPKTRKRKEQD